MAEQSPFEEFRKIKQRLLEIVREIGTGVDAATPTAEELAVIKGNFDEAIDRERKALESLQRAFNAKPRPARPARRYDPNLN